MKNKCNQCGCEMIDKSCGPYINLVCPKCGNAIATFDESKKATIERDEKIYSVVLEKNISPSMDAIKIVSKQTGENYIKSKELLLNGGTLLKEKAVNVLSVAKECKKNGITFKIIPKFPYDY